MDRTFNRRQAAMTALLGFGGLAATSMLLSRVLLGAGGLALVVAVVVLFDKAVVEPVNTRTHPDPAGWVARHLPVEQLPAVALVGPDAEVLGRWVFDHVVAGDREVLWRLAAEVPIDVTVADLVEVAAALSS